MRFWLLLGLVMILATTGVIAGPPSANRTLFTNSLAPVPGKWASKIRSMRSEHLTDQMEIEIPLRMRDYAKLLERIGRGEVLSHAEMEAKYLPTASDYEAVAGWLAAQGFTVTRRDPNRLAIFVRGTVSQLQQSLQVEMGEITVDNVHFNLARTHPSLPNAIAKQVLGINGLQPYQQMRKHAVAIPASGTDPNKTPYLVSEILGAYNAKNLGVTGAGQKIAILIDTPPASSDLTAFWAANNIPQTLANIETVNVNNATLPAPTGEESLDVEWSSGIAPSAKVRVYASGSLSFTALDAALQGIISDLPSQPDMHQLSISLGLGESYLASSSQMQTDAQYFATIASSGVSIFVSSGDGGSTPDSSGGSSGPLQTEYYASDPSVTGVGGTSLYLDAATGLESNENAWSGSGGGASQTFTRPTWQAGSGVPAGATRLVPDVSFAADPNTGAYVYLNGSAWQFGGTSWSAPSWAGLTALINASRAASSKAPLGFLNPSLYLMIGTDNFRDVTSGNNGQFNATTGYDRVTGIGAPNVARLMQTLTAPGPAVTGISPASGTTGTNVILTGANLTQVGSVQFNKVNAFFTVNSATQITAIVPKGAATGAVSVVAPAGTGTSATNFTLTSISVPNDNFASAQVISGNSGSVTGSTAGATRQSGEPNHAWNVGGASIWYAWTAPASGTYTFDTVGSSFDTLLAIYIGSSVNNLALVAGNDDSGNGITGAVSFAAIAGTTYRIAIDGHNGVVGSAHLNWVANNAAPSVTSFVPNSGDPGTAVVLNGANFTGVTSVQFNGTPAALNATSPTELTVTVPSGASSGFITVTTPAGVATSPVAFTVSAAPGNDTFANAAAFPGNFGTVIGNNIGATKESGEPNHGDNPGGKSVWWNWTAPATAQYLISTKGSSFDTLLAVYSGNSVATLTAYGSNDNNAADGTTSAVTLNATAGAVYHIAVDGANGASGNIVLSINQNTMSSSLYSTGFETAEGYSSSSSLAGQNGWLKSGSGGNGLTQNSAFSGLGLQAYIGKTGLTGSSLSVLEPINFTPAANDTVNFSVLADIVDSTNGHYDLFHWDVCNIAGHRLFTLEFNNATNAISYILDDTTGTHATSATLSNGHVYDVEVTINFAGNIWSASLDGITVVTNQAVTTSGAALNLGSIQASWVKTGSTAGNNYMLFDNYGVTKTGPAIPQFGTQPQSQTVNDGANVVFNAAAYGASAIAYQWRKNGVNISGAVGASYSLPAAHSSDAGTYDVVATNSAGSVVSAPAALTVNASYNITAVASPGSGGTTSGSGAYFNSGSAIVSANAASNYAFTNWTENGSVVSTSATYAFTISGNRNLTAHFQPVNYSTWSAVEFNTAQAGGSSTQSSPANDGITNLQKYAFNLDPNTDGTWGLPKASILNNALTLTFRLNKTVADVSLVVEVSNDLVSWNSGSGFTTAPLVLSDDGATQILQVQDLTPASSDLHRFIRLKVAIP